MHGSLCERASSTCSPQRCIVYHVRLQGFPRNRVQAPLGVSERQMRLMIGNSFCVTVVAKIFDRLLEQTLNRANENRQGSAESTPAETVGLGGQ